ncbi:MAG TPA: response regulator [Chitinivibrionales bacterium]|nr:response regulator [Chitinivibrionales bacterium]
MKKILIIDDDKELREVMTTVLSTAYECRQAGSKKEGLAVLKTFTPDLVILDVMMETMNAGFDAAREIKSQKKLKNVKIMVITNVDRKTGMDFRSEAGDQAWLPVDEYYVKPIDPKELIARVQKLI